MFKVIDSLFNSIDKSKFSYKVFYLFVSLTFVTVLKTVPNINILSKVSLVWAALIIFHTIFKGFKKRKVYLFDIFLMSFLIFNSVLVLLFYNTGENIIICIVNAVLFLTVFSIDIFINKKDILKEINRISFFYVLFMFVMSTISLFMRGTGAIIKAGGFVFEGIEGGLFENKNAISIAASIAFVLTIYLLYTFKTIKIKLFLLFNALVQLTTVFSFKGRSAYLIFIGIIFTLIYIYIKNNYVRILLLLSPIIGIILIYSKVGYTALRVFTSGRVNLWISAFTVIDWHTFRGVGHSDLSKYIHMVNLTKDLPGLETGGLHNIYIQIATENGIFSIILFALFLILFLNKIVVRIDLLRGKEKTKMTILLSLLVGILAINFFESTLINIISYMSIIFWAYSGYLISYLENKNLN